MKSAKRSKKKTEQGVIVRSTTFYHMKKLPPEKKRGKVFQQKVGDRKFEIVTYRNHTKIITRLSIALDAEKARAIFKKDFTRFEKKKTAMDFGGSVQRYDGRIKTVRQGKVHIAGAVTKSSHLYSIIKRKTRKWETAPSGKKTWKHIKKWTLKENRKAEFHNKLIDTFAMLETFTFEHYR